MNIPESILSKLTDEQKARITSATSVEDVLSIVKDIGLELTDEQLEGLAGGTGPLDYPYKKTGPLGYVDAVGPVGGAVGPVGETGPLKSCDPPKNETGPLNDWRANSCDPANETGPLGWYDKT